MDLGQSEELLTLDRLFERAFGRYEHRTAVKFGPQTLDYGTLDEQSAKLADAYHALGLSPGDRVGILMENRPEFVVARLGAIRAGVTFVPLNSELNPPQVRELVERAELSALVVDGPFFDVVRGAQQEIPELNHVIGHATDRSLPMGFHDLDEILRRAEPTVPDVDIAPDDVAAVYYTGGTTGEPKGVVHTHLPLVLNAFVHMQELDIGEHEQMLLVTPLSHSAGPFARVALAQGGTVVLQQGFDSGRVLRTIETDGITWMYLVPTMVSQVLNDDAIAETDTDTLETLAYGAAPIPQPVLRDGIDRFGRVFVQFYGLTEVPNLITVLPKSEHDPDDEHALDSAGYPTQLVEVAIRDVDGVSERDDEVGEIVVRSAYTMRGYTGGQSAFDEDGWLETGDVGRIDDQGRVHVLDRLDDVIVRDDTPVYSTVVESAIQRHPAIRQVGVIGVPSQASASNGAGPQDVDRHIKAIVVPETENGVDLNEIREFCRDQLDRDLPDSVDVVGTLPETPYGKIDKAALRDPYW